MFTQGVKEYHHLLGHPDCGGQPTATNNSLRYLTTGGHRALQTIEHWKLVHNVFHEGRNPGWL